MTSRNSDKNEDEEKETVIRWWSRYVFVPIAVAITAGIFAIIVVTLERPTPVMSDSQMNAIVETMIASEANVNPRPVVTVVTTVITKEVPVTVPAVQSPEQQSEQPPEDNRAPVSTSSCGYVPPGWVTYGVRWGDTLYSLSRRTGASIEMIQQVNCIFDGLKAGTIIWLPSTPVVILPEPEPELPTVTPTATLTPYTSK